MADLREVIRKAWLDLDAQAAPLHAREAALKQELRNVQRDIEQLLSQVSDVEKAAKALGMDLVAFEPTPTESTKGQVSIKQAIRLVLSASFNGLTSHDLHQAVSKYYFRSNLDRTSFSPQLSRMRAAGEVDTQDGFWTLKPEGRQILAASASAERRSKEAANFLRHSEQYRLPDDEDARIKILENE